MAQYGINFLNPKVNFPNGNLFSLIPTQLWNNETSIPNLLCVPNNAISKNRNKTLIYVLDCLDDPQICVNGETEWGIHRRIPWGEFEMKKDRNFIG